MKDTEKLPEEEKQLLIAAVWEELDSLEENNTWKLIEMKKVISQMKRKLLIPNGDFKSGNEGNIVRHKAQLAAKGCSQKYG